MKPSLFLGLQITSEIEERLKKVNSYDRNLYLSGEEGLKKVEHQGKFFLGKEAASFLAFEELDLLETHIRSIINRLIPTLHLPRGSLELLAREPCEMKLQSEISMSVKGLTSF